MKILMIGCGAMGSTIARHLAKSFFLILSDRNEKKNVSLAKEIGGTAQEDIAIGASDAGIVFLAIKPKDLNSVAEKLAGVDLQGKLVVSVLAGTPVALLRRHFPLCSVLRIMPNLALSCGRGVIGLVDDEALTQELKLRSESLFKGMGLTVWLPEDKMNAFTALTSSGIGFVFFFIEAMMEGGIRLGFSEKEAREFTLKTVEGAVGLLRSSGKHPSELKGNVASAGGMTMAGLKELEDAQVRLKVINALLAACSRGKQMETYAKN